MIHIEPGDTVFHRPSREEWIVRRVDDGYLYWFGWPPGRARLADCLLVEKATAPELAHADRQAGE